MADVKARFRVRSGTAAAWASANPVLLSGEPGFETDTGTLRVGDGVTAFTSLPVALVLSNNLSDLPDKDASLSNLGGTTVGIAVFKAADGDAGLTALGATATGISVAKAASAAAARSAIELGSANSPTFAGITATGNASVQGNVTLGKGVKEAVYSLSGTNPDLDPENGTIQTHLLSGNTTYTAANIEAGESLTLMIDDGAGYTITWPTMTWVNNGGLAPTLATTGYTVVVLWKVGSTLYGALVGDGS